MRDGIKVGEESRVRVVLICLKRCHAHFCDETIDLKR